MNGRWAPPAEFDHLRDVRSIDEDGKCKVYLGHDTVLNRPVALQFAGGTQQATRARFLVEAEALARLSNPNVVGVYRFGEIDGRPYLVYELTGGRSLEQLPVPMPWRRALAIGIGVVRGLAAAHARGVLHRDVRPANVMLVEGGGLKLINFALTNPGDCAIHGSDFLAPEVRAGATASAQSDIFSFGLLLHWLCTGQLLPEVPLQKMSADVSVELAAVIARCTQKDPNERFRSPLELRNVLEMLSQKCSESPMSIDSRPCSGQLTGLHAIHTGRQYVVFRALRNGQPAVVKTVRPEIADARSEARLRHEFGVLEALGVQGVVRPLALEKVFERAALILEDVGARTLSDAIHRQRLDVKEFLELAIQMAAIVAGVHGRNIIHRDLCPANFVLNEDDRLTLVDFDLATTITEASRSVSTIRVSPYLAPELSARMKRKVDPRADLYSLGSIFYEMLTGSPPFPFLDPVELVHAHLAQIPVPPTAVNAAVPPLLSDLVLKLLAKMPEWRYQTAEALHGDLLEAQRLWASTSSVGSFELGRLDRRELQVSTKFYGRKRELAAILSAIKRTADGANELMVVKGVAGGGKTALVEESRARSATSRRLLAGKCEQLVRNVPFAPFAEALRGFTREILEMPAAAVETLRKKIQNATAPNGRILTDLVPELEQLLGEPPPLMPLGPIESASRAEGVFVSFVRAVACPEQPLMVLIDDLQWIDPASLNLLRKLVSERDIKHLLVIVAWRSEEVSADHPAAQAVRELSDGGAEVHEIDLGPLDLTAVASLLSDTLACDADRARALGEIVVRKTLGNPLFVQRFLRALDVSGLLTFDIGTNAWVWDARAIADAPTPEDVVELLVASIRRLPEPAQKTLQVAACIGSPFEMGLLARTLEKDSEEVGRLLRMAVREALVVPAVSSPSSEAPPLERCTSYRFAHDRVQQAAYSIISENDRKALHLVIGRCLLAGSSARSDALFLAADHLNRAVDLMETEVERFHLLELNEQAAGKAKSASAYGSALAYLQQGIRLLSADAWRSHHDLAFRLHRDAAELAFVAAGTADGQALADAALGESLSPLERATLFDTLADGYYMRGSWRSALFWREECLKPFGLEWPSPDRIEPAIEEARAAVEKQLAERSLDGLLEISLASDPEQVVFQKNLVAMTNARLMCLDSPGTALATLWAIRSTLEQGYTIFSPVAYVLLGGFFGARGDLPRGYAIGRLGVELGRRFGNPAVETIAVYEFVHTLNHWGAPLRTSVPLLEANIARGIESGALQWAGYSSAVLVTTQWALGTELHRFLRTIEDAWVLAGKFGSQAVLDSLLASRQAARCLKGWTAKTTSFDDAEFNEASFFADVGERQLMVAMYLLRRQAVSYVLRDLSTAVEYTEKLQLIYDEHLGAFQSGPIPHVEYVQYAALIFAAGADGKSPEQRETDLTRCTSFERDLKTWADVYPENYRHKYCLVAAEIARLQGRRHDAERLYHQAIEGAAAEGFVQDEAIADECLGRFHLACGEREVAERHLVAAIDAYARWGATAKVTLLEEEMDRLEIAGSRRTSTPVMPASDEPGLDLLGLLKVTETLSGEVVLDRLLEKMMPLCLKVAGAEQATLVLEEGDTPVVRVVASATGDISQPSVPLATRAAHLPLSVIEHVRKSGTIQVLGEAAHAGPFVSDPYIVQRSVKSVMAVPIRRRHRLVGVLYFENNLTTDAFHPDRVRVFELLSTEIAISLENSFLFEARSRAEATANFLAEASAILAESLDYNVTLKQVVRLAVPFLADWCVIDILEEGLARRVASVHANPIKVALLETLAERYPASSDSAQPAGRVLHTGEPLIREQLADQDFDNYAVNAEHARLLRALGASSLMAVPLMIRGTILGVITFVSTQPSRRYSASDLATAQELARRAVTTLDNVRLYRELQEAVSTRDEFLTLASHELRTPLTSLQLIVQKMTSNMPISSDNLQRTFAVLGRQTVRLTRLVDELLSVSRIQAGKLALELEEIDLVEVVRDVAERFSAQLQHADCALLLEAQGPVVGWWDRLGLDEVATNLIDNAIKFGRGRPIEITIDEQDTIARLVISDHGMGIPVQRMPHIFGRFERAVSASHYGGLGLGLFVAHKILAALGGTIQAENRIGGGATFTVELPRGTAASSLPTAGQSP